MKFFYAHDLDELIKYRSRQFITNRLPAFTVDEVDVWNRYNEDIRLLPFNSSYPFEEVIQQTAFSAAEGHDIDFRILYKKIEIENQPYILMAQIPMIESKDILLTLAVQYIILLFLLFVFLSITQHVAAKRIWKPFFDTLNKVEGFSLEKGVKPKFVETNIVEFTRLNDNLSQLIGDNLTTYAQQKQFIENASHELQTPLAVFQSQLDLLLQDARLNQSQVSIIQSLYDVSSRLARLNKNLFLLAKIDNAQFKELEELDFTHVLNHQLSYLKDLAEKSGIKVQVEVCNSITTAANTTLLESLINNLVVNAIRHNVPDGSMVVTVHGRCFIVSNTGECKPLAPDKIFRRFSRSSERTKGNGLGLAICQQICQLHGWSIEYSYKGMQHHFTVTF